MTKKPVALVDVDGVLNAVTSKPQKALRQGAFRDEVYLDGVRYPLLLNFKQADMVRGLEEHFDVVWATTWNDYANTILAPLLKLPTYPVLKLDVPTVFEDLFYWKLPQIREAFENGEYSGRRFVFFDDRLVKHSRKEFHRLMGDQHLHKLIQVPPSIGLQQHHIDQAMDWYHKHF